MKTPWETNTELGREICSRYEKDPSHRDLPQVVWHGAGGWMHLEFMCHKFGCWAIISSRASGQETGRVSIGTFTTIEDIEQLVAVLTSSRTRELPALPVIEEMEVLSGDHQSQMHAQP